MRTLLRTAFLVIFVAVGLTSAGAQQQWVWVRSPDYTVISDASENDARQVALRLQQIRTTYAAIFHRQGRMSTPSHAVVFALRNPASLGSLGADFKSAAPGSPRVYHGIERWFLNALLLNPNGAIADSAHNDAALGEVAQMLLENNYPRTPLWFDTGIDEYLAALQIEKENVVMGRTPARMAAQNVPLEQVLNATTVPPAEQAAFRRKSWLLVHWILTNGRLSDAGRYFDMVMNRGASPREACLRVFTMSPEEWDKELSTYDPAKNVRTYPLPYVDWARFLGRKLIPAEAKVAVADMALDSPEDEQAAMKTLTGIMQQFPTIAEVHRALAYGYVRRKDLDNGMEHIHTAMQLADSDPLMHFLQAVVLNNGSMDTISVESPDARVSPALSNAIKMDPQFARAYVVRALARLSDGRNDQALSDLRIACGLRPRDEFALLTLAQVQGASGDAASARALYGLLAKSNDPAIAQKAKEGYSNIGREQKEKKRVEEQYGSYRDQTDPRWRVPNTDSGEEGKTEKGPDTRKTEFLQGTLVSTECNDNGSATLSVASGGKAWKLQVPDRKTVLLMNRDNFSCAWRNVKVGVNYKPSGGQTGDIVSLELLE